MAFFFSLGRADAAPGSVREAVRAVILDGRDILLLYTGRYDDYSLPGGGVNPDEDRLACLAREVREETGAVEFAVVDYLGEVEEIRPQSAGRSELVHMRSHVYLCRAARELGVAEPEHYEVSNGMVPRWVDIDAAIAHNERLLAERPTQLGYSIERETLLLRHVRDAVL